LARISWLRWDAAQNGLDAEAVVVEQEQREAGKAEDRQG